MAACTTMILEKTIIPDLIARFTIYSIYSWQAVLIERPLMCCVTCACGWLSPSDGDQPILFFRTTLKYLNMFWDSNNPCIPLKTSDYIWSLSNLFGLCIILSSQQIIRRWILPAERRHCNQSKRSITFHLDGSDIMSPYMHSTWIWGVCKWMLDFRVMISDSWRIWFSHWAVMLLLVLFEWEALRAKKPGLHWQKVYTRHLRT